MTRRSTTRQHSRELEDARHTQRGLLPHEVPQIDGWTIAADSRPVSGIGGDYFDVIPFSRTRFAVCIADVAALIGCSPWTVRQTLIPKGLPYFRFNASGRLTFYEGQVVCWIESQQQGG